MVAMPAASQPLLCLIPHGMKRGAKMPDNIDKQDMRIIKTRKSIINAMSKLLEHQNFRQIAVIDLCEEAMVSRATFYSHYKDKYDLLQHWLPAFKPETVNKGNSYLQLEESVNNFVQSNQTVIVNLLAQPDDEVFEMLHEYILSVLNITVGKDKNEIVNPKNIVLSSFCSGGIVNYLLWQVKNKFPPDVTPMNIYLFEIIEKLRVLD